MNEEISNLVWPTGRRRLLGAMVLLIGLLLLAGAASIPFVFESASILYKFGADKLMLRTGKVLGMIAGTLLLLQLVLAARFRFLDKIFAMDRLFYFHQISGTLIAACVLIHPVLILLPEDMLFIPLEIRYWPEFVGLGLLLFILGMAASGSFRAALRIPFNYWWVMHRMAAVVTAAALFVHVLYVSDTFEGGLPRTLVFWAIGLYGLLYLWVKLKRFAIRQRPYTVTTVEPAAKDAFRLRARPDKRRIRPNAPGQFAFITIKSKNISREEHPFTIAASPTMRPDAEFVIRTSGDWTKKIGNIQPGDLVSIDGPYGLFTHLRVPKAREMVMIAGGIGITPMLSMLRYMADTGDQRKMTLIWSNRSKDHIIFADEFKAFETRLSGLKGTHVLTDTPPSNQLDRPQLEKMLADAGRNAPVFLCGPPQMMTHIKKALFALGFPRRLIFTERFSL
ncbi:MAG: ferric reductase-like transmembrane domain-containing protein [Desulfobacterales bacterium]